MLEKTGLADAVELQHPKAVSPDVTDHVMRWVPWEMGVPVIFLLFEGRTVAFRQHDDAMTHLSMVDWLEGGC